MARDSARRRKAGGFGYKGSTLWEFDLANPREGPVIRMASENEIQNVAAPLWSLLNGTLWPGVGGEFDLVKSAASAVVAHLAYCAIGADEKERRNRAKVVRSRSLSPRPHS